jgi:hypothetical protein
MASTDSTVPLPTRSTVSSPGQATTSCLLAQDEDLILHATRDRVGFNKDCCPPCTDLGKNLYLLLTLLFSFYPIFICRSDQVAWLSATLRPTSPWQRHHQHDSTVVTHQCRHDIASTSRCDQVSSVAQSPARLGGTITSMTQDLHCDIMPSLTLPRQLHR